MYESFHFLQPLWTADCRDEVSAGWLTSLPDQIPVIDVLFGFTGCPPDHVFHGDVAVSLTHPV